MKTRKKKAHFSMPHCDEVKASSGQQIKYNNKNSFSTRNNDICLHRVAVNDEKTDDQPRFLTRSKNTFI